MTMRDIISIREAAEMLRAVLNAPLSAVAMSAATHDHEVVLMVRVAPGYHFTTELPAIFQGYKVVVEQRGDLRA